MKMSEASRNLPNISWKSRIRQILILTVAILLGLIISNALNAQDFQKAQKRHFKAKYKTQINLASQECKILNKKRNTAQKTPHKVQLFAAHSRKPKYKPQAEVDAPRFAMVDK
jgi:5-bromo-4-chloroindolyl phosphate hydrolysis protein